MSKVVRVLSVILAAAVLAGCMYPIGGTMVTGSGRTTTQQFDFEGFNGVNVSSAFKVTIDQGEAYGVSVTIDDNLVQYLDVRMESGTLYVGMKPHLTMGFRNSTQSAEITMPDIEDITLSGATQGTVTGFTSDKALRIEVSGASRLRGDLTAGETAIGASGASTVEVEGTATTIDVEASGASSAKLGKLSCQDARVEASGASTIVVNATGSVRGSASGASNVRYVGEPANVRVDTSGASNVKQD